jgi:hypothetical protein
MAHDLAATPGRGSRCKCCGDAHLSNFALFGPPERQLVEAVGSRRIVARIGL